MSWVVLAIIGGGFGVSDKDSLVQVLCFVVAGMLGLLAHEFGHALTGRILGAGPASIVIAGLGGVTRHAGVLSSRLYYFMTVLAGPMASLLLGILGGLLLGLQIGHVGAGLQLSLLLALPGSAIPPDTQAVVIEAVMSGSLPPLMFSLYGVLFLDETISVLRVIGLVCIVAAVFCSGKTKVRVPAWVYVCCVVVFVLNGCVSILSKLHQIETVQPTISTAAFVMYGGMGRALFCGASLLAVGKKAEKPVSSPWKILGVAVGAAAISGISYLLQLTGARELPATVLYPMVTGGSIIFSALSGLVFFKEQLSKWQIISIALCFVGTLLFL